MIETTPGRILVSEVLPRSSNISFDSINKVMTKKEIEELLGIVYRCCGQKDTVIFVDKLMKLGFKHACLSGISIGKDDIKIPPEKAKFIAKTSEKIEEYELQYVDGLITVGEKYNKVVDVWNKCTEDVAQAAISSMSKRRPVKDGGPNQRGMNSIYMMVNSGARGTPAQLKQLGGMRGLMTKPSGEIIETPILSNFKEGLNELEYFISTNGARKGLADIALKTANSGYLTRKLVDVSQDCVVMLSDCKTSNSILKKTIIENGEVIVSISQQILGRVSAKQVNHSVTGETILEKDAIITEEKAELIEAAAIDAINVRSVLTCEAEYGVCSKCYGRDLATGNEVSIGEAVGVIAAQSIGEPGTQLTMRTFHVGGIARQSAVQSDIISSHSGRVVLLNHNVVRNSDGLDIVMSRSCEVSIVGENNDEKVRYKIPYGSTLYFKNEAEINAGDKIAEWDPYTIPIITEKSGIISFVDLIEGASLQEKTDELTGIATRIVVDHGASSALKPRILLKDESGDFVLNSAGQEIRYFLPVDAVLSSSDGQKVYAGDIVARIPKESSKTKDITGGLPRVIELFEARQPKEHAVMAENDGYVSFGQDYKAKRRLVVTPDDDRVPMEYFIPRGKHIIVNEGDYVKKGDLLISGGKPSPQDILRIMGVQALADYMIAEIQQIYRLQGVKINDKHIEVVLLQMLNKVEITDPGETTLLNGEYISREELQEVNEKALREGYLTAVARPILQGITKAALQTRSFFSAASFQETTKVLTEASVAGKIDRLRGLKENVIVGRLIPAGTGLYDRTLRAIANHQDLEYLKEHPHEHSDEEDTGSSRKEEELSSVSVVFEEPSAGGVEEILLEERIAK